jgi:SanA protein
MPSFRILTWAPASFLLPLPALFVIVSVCDAVIRQDSAGLHTDDPGAIPPHNVGLVLGCSPTLANGRPNLYFENRIDAAERAWSTGKISYLIVSGDNGRESYNEPDRMRDALVARGVPEGRIIRDFAGFRTLDSIIRATDVFQQKRILVISQRFHNERAIFIARSRGIEARGLNVEDVSRFRGWKTKTREKLARVKTVLDLYLLGTTPRFLGDPITIGPD